MEALILAMIIAYAVKKAAGDAHDHWQGSKAANRKASKGRPVRQRARSAARHDTAYWAHQVRGGFPEIRHGLFMGWHSGRIAQLDGREARAKAKADHADLRARVTEAVREQRRRQDEALERIRAAAVSPEPAGPETPPPAEAADGMNNTTPTEGTAMTGNQPSYKGGDFGRYAGGGSHGGGDTSYTQQMAELQAMRRDADEEVNSTRRKRMTSRLDILQGMGLDAATLAEAAAIDDALQAQEKTAQQTLDAVDAAIDGLKKRHGGIKAATDDAPVDKPAEPEFYQD